MTTAGESSRPDSTPPVGALAEEAAQLLDALAVRLAQVRLTVGAHESAPTHEATVPDRTAARGGAARHSAAPDGATHDAATDDGGTAGTAAPADDRVQCVGWCPVCRSADLLRGDRPEVAGKLVDSAIVVVHALRSLLPATPAAGPAAGPPSTGEPGPPPPGIERIDIR